MAKNAAEIAHGPMLIGLLINVLLYGLLIVQMYMYYTAYKHDRKWIKFYVLLLFVMDTVNVVFGCVYIYESLIINFGNMESLAVANWIFAAEPALTAIITTYVQLFYAWRVKIISGKLWLVIPIVLASVMGAGGGLAASSSVKATPRFVDFHSFQNYVIIWVAGECTADILIASTMVWNLRRHKTGFDKSDEIVDKIIRLTIETGVLTTCAAITHLVLYLADHTTGNHLLVNFFMSKLYSNSLMSSLNSRRRTSTGTGEFSTIQRNGTQSVNELRTVNNVIRLQEASRPEVFVQVESHQMSDIHEEVQDKYSYDNRV